MISPTYVSNKPTIHVRIPHPRAREKRAREAYGRKMQKRAIHISYTYYNRLQKLRSGGDQAGAHASSCLQSHAFIFPGSRNIISVASLRARGCCPESVYPGSTFSRELAARREFLPARDQTRGEAYAGIAKRTRRERRKR